MVTGDFGLRLKRGMTCFDRDHILSSGVSSVFSRTVLVLMMLAVVHQDFLLEALIRPCKLKKGKIKTLKTKQALDKTM